MYLEHFGLREWPFRLTPDTDFICNTQSHQEAMNVLRLALETGEGFIKVTGEVGTGKSLACRRLLHTLDASRYTTLYVPNPSASPKALLFSLCAELGIACDGKDAMGTLTSKLAQVLIREAKEGRTVVACLDEAQALSNETLEAIRLLSNLETEKQKLLRVVLFGQPELDERLQQPEVRQILHRIVFQYRLKPLSVDEVSQYVHHRLAVAQCKHVNVFDVNAIVELHHASGGLPRLVNVLAHKCLWLCVGEGVYRVDVDKVKRSVVDTPAALIVQQQHKAAQSWWPWKRKVK